MYKLKEHWSTSALIIWRQRGRKTNLEQSAAAGPFPLCRTAHASFDPENYLKSTEGHIRWKTRWHCGGKFKGTILDFKDNIKLLLTSRLQTQGSRSKQRLQINTFFFSYLLNAEIPSPTFSSAQLVPQAAFAIPLQGQKPKRVNFFSTKLFSFATRKSHYSPCNTETRPMTPAVLLNNKQGCGAVGNHAA